MHVSSQEPRGDPWVPGVASTEALVSHWMVMLPQPEADKNKQNDEDNELDEEEEEEEPEDEEDDSSGFFSWGLFSSTSKYPTGP